MMSAASKRNGRAVLYGGSHSTDRAEALARLLTNRPVRSGRGWLVPCVAHDDRDPSLHISQSESGKPLLHCFAGCAQAALIQALKDRGLWPAAESTGEGSPIKGPNLRPAGAQQRMGGRVSGRATVVHAALSAFGGELWRQCLAIAADDPAGQYLTARGCALPHLSGDLRWHPALRHPSGHQGPALVALITDARSNTPMSLHRTWIAGDGTANKAPADPPRLLLKGHATSGGVIRLWPDDWVTHGLAVAEGVESALTLARGFKPVWSCINAGNLAALPVLPGVDSLTIAVDHDPAGLKAYAAVTERWRGRGREVRRLLAEPGQDFNDWAAAGAN